jgi:hypothetical protein
VLARKTLSGRLSSIMCAVQLLVLACLAFVAIEGRAPTKSPTAATRLNATALSQPCSCSAKRMEPGSSRLRGQASSCSSAETPSALRRSAEPTSSRMEKAGRDHGGGRLVGRPPRCAERQQALTKPRYLREHNLGIRTACKRPGVVHQEHGFGPWRERTSGNILRRFVRYLG